MTQDNLKQIIEGFLFASEKALTVEKIIKLFPEGEQPTTESVEECITEIQASFEGHGIELKAIKSGYRFQVRQETASWVSRLWDEKPAKYTRAMLETLALIVYRQPITRGEIEEIRGVSVSSYIVKTLMEREWVKVIGHRDVPGRPALYASTKEFLDYFNLTSLEELPPLSEIKDLDSIATELDPEQNAALISAIRDMQKEEAEESAAAAQTESQSPDTITDEIQKTSQEPQEGETSTDKSTASTTKSESADIVSDAMVNDDETEADPASATQEESDILDEPEESTATRSGDVDIDVNVTDTEDNSASSKTFGDLLSSFSSSETEEVLDENINSSDSKNESEVNESAEPDNS